MNYLSIFTVSFIIALSGALAPGPLLATVIAKSVKHGFKAGPLVILGHAMLEIMLVLILVTGFSRLLTQPLLTKTVSLLGSSILLLFGIKMAVSAKNANLNIATQDQKCSGLTVLGITMSIANPYWAVWWLTIGLGLILSAQKYGLFAVAVFFLGHILADLTWYSAVSFAVSKGRRFLSEKTYKSIMLFCGIALIAFGIYFAFSIVY
ncbi:MAG: LysE family transporter [Candidatus Omnitrophica bacterium]|nr:LysE family transporter [Candidatus Omnitrophota bacterium]